MKRTIVTYETTYADTGLPGNWCVASVAHEPGEDPVAILRAKCARIGRPVLSIISSRDATALYQDNN